MRVLELWRYPVKSMQGERLDEVTVSPFGVEGDRSHGLADRATGLLLTARRNPLLLGATGRLRPDGAVEVVLPDGQVVEADEQLSRWLGRPVRLERAGPAGAFHDDGNVRLSLVGTATVAALGSWDVRRFRPNIVLDGGDEDALVGNRVGLGRALLDVVLPIVRCVMVTRPQPDGIDRDLDVLRTIQRERAGYLAVGAVVTQPGLVRVGDEIEVLP